MYLKKCPLLIFVCFFHFACNTGITNQPTDDKSPTSVSVSTEINEAKPIPEEALKNFIAKATPLKDLKEVRSASAMTKDKSITEAIRTVQGPRNEKSLINYSVTDFGGTTDQYRRFLSGIAFPQGTEGLVFKGDVVRDNFVGIDLSQVSIYGGLQFSENKFTNSFDFAQLTGDFLKRNNTEVRGQFSGLDNSNINIFTSSIENLAGWEIYDAKNNIAVVILGLEDRLGLLISATEQENVDLVRNLVNKTDFKRLSTLLKR